MSTFNSALWNSFLFGGAGGGPAPPPPGGTGISVFDLIYQAYRIAGVLKAPLRTYNPEEFTDGLNVLNAMVDSWNTEQIMIPCIRKDGFPLVAGQSAYTIGTAAEAPDFTVLSRPNKIDFAGAVITDGTEGPLELPMVVIGIAEWVALQKKNFQDVLPRKLYYENSVPKGKVNVWPTPASASGLNLYSWQQLLQFAAGTDLVIVPQGFLKALEYNLAVELAVREPRNVMNPMVPKIAQESKAAIMFFSKQHYPELAAMMAP